MKKRIGTKFMPISLVVLLVFPLFIQIAESQSKQAVAQTLSNQLVDDVPIDELEEVSFIRENDTSLDLNETKPIKRVDNLVQSLNIDEGLNSASTSQVTVYSESELQSAIANDSISDIIIGQTMFVNNPLYITRRIRLDSLTNMEILHFVGTASLIILEDGIVEVGSGIEGNGLSSVLNINSSNKSKGAAITIDGGELFIPSKILTNVSSNINISDTTNDGEKTGIEVKNGGVLRNSSVLRIESTSNPKSVGILLNNGSFIDTPSSGLSGWIKSGYAILSETGLNTHEFEFGKSGVSVGTTTLYSKIGTPVYRNMEEASLTVSGSLKQMVMWGLNTETNAGWEDPPDYAVGEFQFSVTQVGQSKPYIHSISDSNYSFFFSQGILPMFRAIKSRDGNSDLPTLKLPESIEITPPFNLISVGEKIQLISKITPDPSELDNSSVFWVSSNPSVALVNTYGEITGVNVGETIITGETINGLKATALVRVEEFTFDFNGTEGNSTATVTGYFGSNTEIDIPSEAINYSEGWETPTPVTAIGDAAFESSNLTRASIPEGIEIIGNASFVNNELLTVEIPQTVTTIGIHAFSQNKISELNLPNNVNSIGAFAFSNNYFLSQVHLGTSLEQLGMAIFLNAPLKSIDVAEKNLENYKELLSETVMMDVTERTVLQTEISRYSEGTDSELNLYVGESLELGIVSKKRYQIRAIDKLVWDTAISNVQWFKDDTPLSGENSSTFTIDGVQEKDSGNYHAIVEGAVLESIAVTVSPMINLPIPPIDPNNPNPIDPVIPNPMIEALSLRFVSDLDFGEIPVSTSEQTVYSKPTIDRQGQEIPNMVTVQDMRPENERDNWVLTVKQTNELDQGAKLIMEPFVHKDNKDKFGMIIPNPKLTLNTNAQIFAKSYSSIKEAGIVSLGMDHPENDGTVLELPKNTSVGKIQTMLAWSLVSGP